MLCMVADYIFDVSNDVHYKKVDFCDVDNDFHGLQDDFCDVDNADDECWVSCRVAITVMTNGGGPSNIEGRELRIIAAAK